MARRTATPAERSTRILVAGALILPILVLAIGSAITYRRQFSDARDRLARSLAIAHEHAVKVFETIELVRTQVDQATAGLTDAEIHERERSLHATLKYLSDSLDQVSGIYVFNGAGVPLASARTYPVPPKPTAERRDYFKVFQNDDLRDKFFISDRLVGLLDQKTEFFIVSARRRDGPDPSVFQGIIAVSVEPAYFRDFYASIAGPGLSSFSIDKANGAILARYPDVGGPLVISPSSGFMTAKAAHPERGEFETASAIDGVRRLFAYRRIGELPIYVVLGVDRSAVVADWARGMLDHLLYAVPASSALILLSLIALRRTRREAIASAQVIIETARREKTEDQLRQAQKMEAVGQLTGGLAHDFNNLLTIVIGSLDLAQRRLPDDEPRLAKLIENALEGARRAARLTSRLLAFSRQQPLDPRPLSVNQAIGEMTDIIPSTIGETVRVETVLAAGLWTTKTDRNALESALLNLAVNARDAMAGGPGRLTIETANSYIDEQYAAGRSEVVAGQYVLVAVSDTGSGMSQAVIDRAFDPFFTTKEPGKGTGLGLSQVYGYMKQSGGHVAIYSEPGHGTTVKLYLPRYIGDEVQQAVAPASSPVPATDAPRLLIVEDEDAVRNFAAEALGELGYQVIVGSSGREALAILELDRSIALMLTDVVMPDMDGKRTADQARQLRPDLKVVFMTGYTRNAIIHNGVLDPSTDLITKPFTQAELAAKVERALSS